MWCARGLGGETEEGGVRLRRVWDEDRGDSARENEYRKWPVK